MKRSFLLAITCVSALVLALFSLTACGGDDSSSSDSSESVNLTNSDGSTSEYTSDDIRATFERAVMTMSEFFTGTTPVGETLYYAGGADGENALLVIIVPEDSGSVVFIGTSKVNEDNTLTVSDETTGGTITFSVIDNEDGTYSFSLGEEYGDTIMHRCSSAEVVDALTEVVMATANSSSAAEEEAGEMADEIDGGAEAPTEAPAEE